MLRLFIRENNHERLYDSVAKFSLSLVDLLDFEVFAYRDNASLIYCKLSF